MNVETFTFPSLPVSQDTSIQDCSLGSRFEDSFLGNLIILRERPKNTAVQGTLRSEMTKPDPFTEKLLVDKSHLKAQDFPAFQLYTSKALT